MAIVIQLPEVQRQSAKRPTDCPYCQGETFQRWGRVRKALKDPKLKSAIVERYRCTHCRRTFRHYPAGVGPAQQSARMKKLAAICWALGLSHRGVEKILFAFRICLGRMSSWRDVQAEGEQLRGRRKWQKARVVGVDGAWLRGQGVMVAVDLGDGQPLAIAAIDEKDQAAVLRWLRGLKQRHGIGVIVSDDLAMYRGVAEQLEVGHQVCQFHVRRWVGRACRVLEQNLPEEWHWVIGRVKEIMADLSPAGDKQLLDLYKQVPAQRRRDQEATPLDELRHLLIRLSENWERYTAFFHDPGIPWTNNGSEQAIGMMKIRAKTTRGYKTKSGILNGLIVSSARLG